MPSEPPKRYPLDNAAHLFAILRSRQIPMVFRLAMTLDEAVDPRTLQEALGLAIKRFPCYRVRIVRGIFWHRLEHNPEEPLVAPEEGAPCAHFETHAERGFLFRVLYRADRIMVEFCHVLTDGTGAARFLITLAAVYLRLKGIHIPVGQGVLDVTKEAPMEEAEDAYRRHFRPRPAPAGYTCAYHPRGTLTSHTRFFRTTVALPLPQILALAKRLGVTLTELLSAAYLLALEELQAAQSAAVTRKPVRISIPVNLRTFMPSQTLRNFSLIGLVGIDPRHGGHSFEEILALVHDSLRLETSEKQIRRQLSRNIRAERLALFRAFPLILKQPLVALAYRIFGESVSSGGLSNLGLIAMPDEMGRRVTDVEYIPSLTRINKYRCGAVSFHDLLYLTISRVCAEDDLVKKVLAILAGFGLPIQIREPSAEQARNADRPFAERAL